MNLNERCWLYVQRYWYGKQTKEKGNGHHFMVFEIIKKQKDLSASQNSNACVKSFVLLVSESCCFLIFPALFLLFMVCTKIYLPASLTRIFDSISNLNNIPSH